MAKKEPKKIKIGGAKGIELKCAVCSNSTFHSREAQLNTPGMTALNLDWANHTAKCYACSECGYIHWFM